MSWHFSAALEVEFLAASSSAGAAAALWSEQRSAPDDSCSGKMKATFHRSPFGTMFVPSTDALGVELLKWFLEDSRAKASPLPAMAPDWITRSRHFGAIKPASLASLKPPLSGLRTHQRSLFGEEFELLETLPRWGMIVGGELYPLPTPSGLTELRASITSESGSGLPERLPTPKASEAGPDFAKLTRSNTGLSLQTAVAIRVPTPKSEDGQCAGGHRDKNDTLYGLICRPKRIPTPTTQDAANNGPPSQQERNTKPLNAEVGGPLNPDWVEWLMGWPIGWTDSKPLETDRFQLWLNSHGSC